MPLLENKTALVTGGTSGLGRSIAVGFAKHGASVVVLGTKKEKAESVIQELNTLKCFASQKFSYVLADVSQKQQIDKALADILVDFGNVNILVNCAGITRDSLFLKMSEENWDNVITTNLKSVYNVTHYVIRAMIKSRNGKIINIASVIGQIGNPGQVNYSASKAGMIGFTKSLAKEVGSRGICVNCIAPGFFETPMTDALSDEQKKSIYDKIPMRRLGNPEELANAAIFLASDMSNYITGETLTVDGGMIS